MGKFYGRSSIVMLGNPGRPLDAGEHVRLNDSQEVGTVEDAMENSMTRCYFIRLMNGTTLRVKPDALTPLVNP